MAMPMQERFGLRGFRRDVLHPWTKVLQTSSHSGQLSVPLQFSKARELHPSKQEADGSSPTMGMPACAKGA